MQEVRILTHESVIHYQIDAIEKLLNRELNCLITLNQKFVVSNIQFMASEVEIEAIREDLRFKLYTADSGHEAAFKKSRSQ